MTKILITGGTGLVGQHLSKELKNKGYQVAILSRNPKQKNEFKWDVSNNYIDEKALENTSYIIHLAGAGIADKRWTEKRKEILIKSRVATANLLLEKVKEFKIPLKGFISASGIGYYGAVTSETIFTETHSPKKDFISKICIEWEEAAQQFESINVPVTILRTGIVLSKKGGALKKMNTPLFLAALGSGKQFMPWIHIEDLSNMYIKAIEDPAFKGVFNAVAPNQDTNLSFTKILGKVLNKAVLPIHVPGFVLKIALGELAVILLKGSRISSEKTETQYQFIFNNLQEALKEIYPS